MRFTAWMVLLPDTNQGVVVLMNASNVRSDSFNDKSGNGPVPLTVW